MESGHNLLHGEETGLPIEAKNVLNSLASSWEDVIDSHSLQAIPLKGAMTNEVFEIKWKAKVETPRRVIVRVYGEGVEVFFDRDDEVRIFEFMSKHGHGPRLLGRFTNGRIEEFIHARTLSSSDLRDPDISARIAAKMNEFHNLDVPNPRLISLWDRLRKWVTVAKNIAFKEESDFQLDDLNGEISLLEKKLGDNQMIGFCHNDLQYGNIMMDDETRAITIIDYEYASYNPTAYDIANHFCEWTANYHSETPHVLDYSKYPNLDERRRFLHAYFSYSGNSVDNLELEQTIQNVEKYTLVSHLHWGLWGLISEHVNDIDFDYLEYARQRFRQYWLSKPALLGS